MSLSGVLEVRAAAAAALPPDRQPTDGVTALLDRPLPPKDVLRWWQKPRATRNLGVEPTVASSNAVALTRVDGEACGPSTSLAVIAATPIDLGAARKAERQPAASHGVSIATALVGMSTVRAASAEAEAAATKAAAERLAAKDREEREAARVAALRQQVARKQQQKSHNHSHTAGGDNNTGAAAAATSSPAEAADGPARTQGEVAGEAETKAEIDGEAKTGGDAPQHEAVPVDEAVGPDQDTPNAASTSQPAQVTQGTAGLRVDTSDRLLQAVNTPATPKTLTAVEMQEQRAQAKISAANATPPTAVGASGDLGTTTGQVDSVASEDLRVMMDPQFHDVAPRLSRIVATSVPHQPVLVATASSGSGSAVRRRSAAPVYPPRADATAGHASNGMAARGRSRAASAGATRSTRRKGRRLSSSSGLSGAESAVVRTLWEQHQRAVRASAAGRRVWCGVVWCARRHCIARYPALVVRSHGTVASDRWPVNPLK